MKKQRITRQSVVIRNCLREAKRPLGPIELHELAKRELPRIGIATVYRALSALLSKHVIVEIPVPGEPSRYEMREMPHHHHFRCRICERILDVEVCPGTMSDKLPEGFIVERHELWLYGVCADCASK